MTSVIRWGLWLACALPGLVLVWHWQTGQLGVVPHEVLLHRTGRFALLLLMATLGLGFVQSLLPWRPLYAARRPLGVWTFLYASAHAAVWLMLDQGGILEFAWAEMRKMLHVKLGIAGLLLMLPLAVTSVDIAPRLLGFRLWKRLHLLVWPTALVVIAHTWVVSRFQNLLVIGLTLAILFLLASRLYAARKNMKKAA
ncbi:sulfoxide reductase heme-binding subunit YedZ [Roseinatronobacter thiooxidans]|uniref:Sulfoxide reductase heme-binding subunit YedZ n=1 Tax=Roseinatronobacter thiooxidans TaxID=121821 RepID=A0A2W7QW39_9RHOB|nr:ferric reductase-like transmembrane domain-containing protein [Roseinatronobacter thiooxidans]PZX47877.1 sulfoxide reductase heme-binding subunit YedZ [Roseinatronobacter thiooxidans]